MDLTKPLTKAAFKKQLASQPFGAIGELVYDFLYRQIITMDLCRVQKSTRRSLPRNWKSAAPRCMRR